MLYVLLNDSTVFCNAVFFEQHPDFEGLEASGELYTVFTEPYRTRRSASSDV
jgi:hypothetical protein